jgi:hypothetical protein
MLYALGMARDFRSIALLRRIETLLSPSDEDFRDFYKGTYYYIDAICFALERLGHHDGIPILENLHKQKSLNNKFVTHHLEVDFVYERQALLELGIGRALAYCGSPRGLEILINYLNDNRRILGEYAHKTLAMVTGRDLGVDASSWKSWLIAHRDSFTPPPLLGKIDG